MYQNFSIPLQLGEKCQKLLIKKDIKEEIRAEVEDLLGVKKIKKDIKKTVRGEVEKLIRERQPFRS